VAVARVNGADLYYEERGSGPPLLLIHGNGSSVRIWGRSIDDLAVSHRVIAYDRRGFDRSSGPLANTLSEHADDAVTLLRELSAEPARIVGWSAGGVVALDLASRYPASVSSLVLVEAALHLVRDPAPSSLRMTAGLEFQRRVRRDDGGAARRMERWALAYTTGGTAFDRFPEEWQEAMVVHAPAVLKEIGQLFRLYPGGSAVASITCPVTWLEGTLSQPTFHDARKRVCRLIPHTRLVIIEGASHAIHFDRPIEFAQAVSVVDAA